MHLVRRRPWALVGLLAVAGCDGTGGPVFTPDGGTDALVTPDGGHDAAVVDGGADAGRDGGHDTDPPHVTSTRPRSGETHVALDREVEVRFSERVVLAGGTVTATATDGTSVALAVLVLDDTSDVVRVRPETSWPTTTGVTLTIDAFEDLAGNAMSAPAMLSFTTEDEGPPAVVEASPVEGATDVDVALGTITIRFSEPMSPHLGTAALPGALVTGQRWTSETDLEVTIGALAFGTTYALALEGFEDVEGNALDTVSYLVDGALDFATAGDTTAPTLVDSTPTSHQTDIDVLALPEIVLSFSEPMDRAVRTADLDDGTRTTTLTGNWNESGTELRFAVAGRLALSAEHRLDLTGLRDRSGNSLDPATNLDAGELVFTTTATDASLPVVLFTSPGEGSNDFGTRAPAIEVLFSEAMVTTRTDVTLVGPGITRTLTGTWNGAGTRLTLPVGAPLPGRTALHVDLHGFTDPSGNALDDTHPYLGDGVLDFTTAGPTGETCGDPLTLADATLEGAAHVWELGGPFTAADASPSCGPVGLRDAIVLYEKTTPALGELGGRALRITATMSRVHLFNLAALEVSSSCGGGAAAREVCLGPSRSWVQYLDVPAGAHFVSIGITDSNGTASASPWSGVELRIEEVDSIPEGESCSDPFDAASAIHTSPGPDLDVFLIPHAAGTSLEAASSTAESISCRTTDQGPDVVLQLEKRRPGSILDVAVDPFPSTDWSGTGFEVRTSCEGPSATPIACQSSVASTPRNFQVSADAGPLWLWVVARDPESPLLQTEVRVHEIDPGPGESCASAIPITPNATTPITPIATTDYFHPSCLPAGAVTWYRYTTTHEVTSVRTTGVAPTAMVLASTSAELGCAADATQANLGFRLPVGSDVCVAVPSTAGPSAITVADLDWRGVVGTPTVLPITRPVDGTGAPVTITSEAWLTASPDSLFMAINVTSTTTSALVIAPRTGGEASRVLTTAASLGNGGAMRGGALFSIDERTSGATRLFRLVSPAGTIETPPTGWDPGSTYPAFAMRGLAAFGTDQLAMAGASSSAGATFLTASSASAAAVISRGTSTVTTSVNAVAASPTHVFFTGNVRVGTASARTSVYRLPWSALTSQPVPLVPPELVSVGATGTLAYDATRDILYFRSTRTGDVGVFAILDASSATPTYAGRVLARGRSGDTGLALDEAIPSLFLFETETVAAGAFVEVR